MSRDSDMSDSSFRTEEDGMRECFAEFPGKPILRLSFPIETGIRIDVALVIQDPHLWSLLVCAPGKEKHVRLHRAEALDILEGKRDPVPTDAAYVRKELEGDPLSAYELFILGEAERLYERNQSTHRYLEDTPTPLKKAKGLSKEKAKEWKPDLREVILMGLRPSDRQVMAEIWPPGESMCLLHTMHRSPRFNDVVARHYLNKFSFEDFQWAMWKLSCVVWDGYALALPTRQRTLPVKLPRLPEEIRVTLWGKTKDEMEEDDDRSEICVVC